MKKQSTLQEIYKMRFEYLVRQVLGKGYGIASLATNAEHFRGKIKKVIEKMIVRVDNIEMDSQLKQMLILDLTGIKKNISNIKSPSKEQISLIASLSVISRLLGYDFLNGKVFRTPIYTRTIYQEQREVSYKKGDDYYKTIFKKEDDLILKRYELSKRLKEEGYTYAEIAFILKMTSGQVQKLLKSKIKF